MSAGVLWVLDCVVLLLTLPVSIWAGGHALQASRRARAARSSALDASLSARLAIADADRARELAAEELRLMVMARVRLQELYDAAIAVDLPPPLMQLPALCLQGRHAR